MGWIPGGEFSMGAAMAGQAQRECPWHRMIPWPIQRVFRVDGF